MKKNSIYSIPLNGLKEGIHQFDYQIDVDFFKKFENEDFQYADIDVSIELNKKTSFLELIFEIEGEVELICDRCLDNYMQEISWKDQLFVKFGERNSDLSDADQTITIAHDETGLSLDQHLYDYIMLSLPYKHMHPDDEDGNSTCDPEMLAKLDEYHKEEDIAGEEEMDPRWAALKNLKKN